MRHKIGLIAGPLLFLIACLLPAPEGLGKPGLIVLAAAVWMALWWLTEAIPIPATALLPMVIFPLSGVSLAQDVSQSYMDRNIVLFMGGFFLAQAIQKWKLHRRMALWVLVRVGSHPSRLVLGFMLATAFLSMWVSNTATAIMMLPIATAVVSQLTRKGLDEDSRFPAVLMLAIAYSASIGGVATLIGTPPNLVLASQYALLFPDRPEIGFVQWMAVGLPLTALFIPLVWLYLTRVFSKLSSEPMQAVAEYLVEEQRNLGAMSRGEKWVSAIFVLTALGWIFRRDLALGGLVIPGWASLLGVAETTHDSTVAIFASLLLFCIPVSWRKREFLMDWESARQIPWGILILFGGGIALAGAVRDTGLASWIGNGLSFFGGLPEVALIAVICLTITFLTEVTSNTAVATIFMPILAGLAGVLEVSPLLLMVPGAISASCAFMLPVATPPNAIVFASGKVTMPQMSRAGLRLNILGAVLTTLLVYGCVEWIFA